LADQPCVYTGEALFCLLLILTQGLDRKKDSNLLSFYRMPEISLKTIAEVVGGEITGNGSQKIRFLETDSRRINYSPETLFIAISGIRHDGHEFISELIDKGFTNFLVNQNKIREYKKQKGNFIGVSDTVDALQQLAGYARKQLTGSLVAITGSNGKTVVKEWLFQCLSRKHSVSRSPRSYNSQIGVPLSLWLLNPISDWSIIEAGISKPGEMNKLEAIIRPDAGIITNIGQAHQENFSSLENKLKEKLLLFRNATKIFYCLDHSMVHRSIEGNKGWLGKEFITWSQKDPTADLYIEKTQRDRNNTRVHVWYKEEKYEFLVPFTDEASWENAMHILSFLMHYGFPVQEIKHGLSGLSPVAMRLEQIKGIKDCTLINDSYNSDINSLRIALDFLSLQKQHSRCGVILSDLQQTGLSDKVLYKEVFRLLKSFKIDQIILVGDKISTSATLPENAVCYTSTEKLLKDIETILLPRSALLIKGARNFEFERITGILSEKKHTTVLEINMNHLVHNLNYFRSLLQPGTRIMVMVKALSYGSGSHEIANLLQHEKVDYLGVAYTDEGVELREKGITLSIMVMSPDPESFDKIIAFRLEPEIFNFRGLEEFSRAVAANQLQEYPVHIKIDTGMHRLGFLPEEIPLLLEKLKTYQNIRIKAVFSHLAASDSTNEDVFTLRQIDLFQKAIEKFHHFLGYKPISHILNSAGIERFPQAHFDMVRLGIGLHGISSIHKNLKPVSTLKSSIVQIKHLRKGETVGYNRREVLRKDSDIAIIPIGYADGLDRKSGNRNAEIFLNHQKAPYIGDICMDLCMVDITGMRVQEGDEVIIFGAEISIQELAEKIQTIPYEILTNVSSRVKRKYINE